MSLRVVAAAAVSALAFAQFSGSFCMEKHRCKFFYTDTGGVEYSWDLSTLCKPLGTYSFNGTSTYGQTFYFNVCGNTSQVCSDYKNEQPMYESHGVATQVLQASYGVRSNAGSSCLREDNLTACPDWTFGGTTCCSVQRCEVVALEAMTFDLVDNKNPGTGGVVIKHMGMPSTDDDQIKCPTMQGWKNPLIRNRQFILTLQCDPNGVVDDLKVVNYDESSEYCIFKVTATTKAACAFSPDPSASPTPSHTPSHSPRPSASGTPAISSTPSVTPSQGADAVIAGLKAKGALVDSGGQFGYTILGACLLFAFQLGHGFAMKRGGWYSDTVGRVTGGSRGQGQTLLPATGLRYQGVSAYGSAGSSGSSGSSYGSYGSAASPSRGEGQ